MTHSTFPLPRPPSVLKRIGVCGFVLMSTLSLCASTRPPGDVIIGQLDAAAGAVREIRWSEPRENVRKSINALFPGYSVETDVAKFPVQVAVTLHDLDKKTCLDAWARVRRVEGPVVIDLQKFSSPEECGAENDMTWLILP